MAEILAPDVDRLPWLTDDKAPRQKTSRLWLGLLVILGAMAIAAISFWYGQTLTVPADEEVPSALPQTVPLPAPATPAPIERATHEAEPAPMPDVARGPAPAPVVLRMQRDVRPVVQSEPRPVRVVHSPERRAHRFRHREDGPREERAQLLEPVGFIVGVGQDGSRRDVRQPAPRQGRLVEAGQGFSGDEEASGRRHRHSVAAERARFITGSRSEPLHRLIPKCFASG